MSSLTKLKNLVTSKSEDDECTTPQLGFKISYNEELQIVKVRVIGARQLPALYGNARPEGYLVKVRVFPGKEKFETQLVKESWPTFNDEFQFSIQVDPRKNGDDFTGKFVILTVYALLRNADESKKSTRKNVFSRFFSSVLETNELKRNSRTRSSKRMSLTNRRTIGAVTYNLEPRFFTLKFKNDFIGTPDVWRQIQNISSGLEVESRESKKGALEVTLMYSPSEDGKNDLFEVSLSKLRCSMNTMTEHEKLKGSLYVKMKAFQQEVLISKWKSDNFEPTISLKIEPESAVLQAFVDNTNLENVYISVTLMCKNMLGKKTLLGTILIDNTTKIWKQAVLNPSTAATRIINLE